MEILPRILHQSSKDSDFNYRVLVDMKIWKLKNLKRSNLFHQTKEIERSLVRCRLKISGSNKVNNAWMSHLVLVNVQLFRLLFKISNKITKLLSFYQVKDFWNRIPKNMCHIFLHLKEMSCTSLRTLQIKNLNICIAWLDATY